MWLIENPEIKKSKFDFTSSGQGHFEVSQLVCENVVLMNALELMQFDADSVQVIICDHCGNVQCKSGDWVCIRKSGSLIFLIPYFDEIELDNWKANEFAPPNYYDKLTHTRKKGMPYFDLETYENLRDSFPGFPSLEQIQNLKMSEAVRIAQQNIPFQLFGEPSEVLLNSDKKMLVVGASEGDANEYLQKIEAILRENYENDSAALVRKRLPFEEIIYIFLDADEFIDWQALVKDNENFHLILEENFVIIEES